MLLQELTDFYSAHDTTNFNVLDFVHAFGSPLEAMAYSKLFWPDFVELDGMVFRKDVVEDESDRERVRKAVCTPGWNLAKVEAGFNIVEVPHLFGKRGGEGSDDLDCDLARVIGEMWYARLQQVFPNRKFTVEVDIPSDEPTVTFYQERK